MLLFHAFKGIKFAGLLSIHPVEKNKQQKSPPLFFFFIFFLTSVKMDIAGCPIIAADFFIIILFYSICSCYARFIPNLSESMEIAVCAQTIYISEHIIFLIKLSLHLLICLAGYCRQSKSILLPGMS